MFEPKRHNNWNETSCVDIKENKKDFIKGSWVFKVLDEGLDH